jgi:hypothetical protein
MGVADDIDTLVGQLNGLFAAYAIPFVSGKSATVG